MPAPTDPIRYKIWIENLSKSHKGVNPWNRGLIMSDSFRKKVSENSKIWWQNQKNKEKILIRNKKVALSKMGDKNPMKRPEIAKKVSLYMTKRMLSDKNPMYNSEVRAKVSSKLMGHEVPQNIREKISRNLVGKLIGDKNPFWGKHHTIKNIEKSRIRAINMITSGLLSSRRTEIEVKTREALLKTNLKFREQVPLENITVVDFYLPENNIVIYCDGDYWHRGEWAKKHRVINKDNWQTKTLENKGYKVFRFSETEINASTDRCISLVQNYIKTLS